MESLRDLLWQGEEGQDLVEYGLLLALITLVAVATMGTIGSVVSNVFSDAATALSTSS